MSIAPASVYLIRHCEAEGNIHRRLHGIFDSDVTPRGERQLRYLAERFSRIELDAVYASDLYRAVTTARAVAGPHGLAVESISDLNERAMGVFEDKTWHEVREKLPTEFSLWRADPANYVIPGGESENGAAERLWRTIKAVAGSHRGQTVAMVTHSMLLKRFLEQLAGGDMPYSDNTAVSLLRVDGESMELVFANDASHLPKAEGSADRENWQNGRLDRYSLAYQRSEDQNGVIITGWDGDASVGFIQVRREADALHIADLYVEPWARRRGFATQLLGESLYRSRPVDAVTLTPPDGNISPGLEGFLLKNRFQENLSARSWTKRIHPQRNRIILVRS